MTFLRIAAFFAATLSTASAQELPVSRDATFRRGNDAYFHGRYGEAVDAYEHVVALGVVSENLYYNLANAYAAQGNFGGAAEQFGEAAKLNPDDAMAEANLGTALVQLGRLQEARTHYEAALRIDSSNQLARENLQQLEQLIKESQR